MLQSGSIECNGIETDIVVQIYSVCASGVCKNSTLNPVVSTRAKAKLIITKFRQQECEKCGYKRTAEDPKVDVLKITFEDPEIAAKARAEALLKFKAKVGHVEA